jgi:2-dehydropantoate 2-reductase
MATGLPFMEPIHILGSGSVGLFWAASIRSAFPSFPLAVLFRGHHRRSRRFSSDDDGAEVMICTRQLGDFSTNGGTRRGSQSRPRMARVPYQFIDDVRNRRKIRNLILCTKAYQAEDAIRGIERRLDPSNLRILLLCNGALDVREKLSSMLKSAKPACHLDLVMCATTHGVVNETPSIPTIENGGEEMKEDEDDDMFHLLHTGIGRSYIGQNESISQLFDLSGLRSKSLSLSQMEVLLWSKHAANCVCNPLTALYDLTNGRLTEIPGYDSKRKQIVEEVSKVATAMNPQMKDELSTRSLDQFVEQVIQENLRNKSSMYHDLQQQKRTEVENLNGYVVRKTAELGFHSAPANEELLRRIRELTVEWPDER